MIFKLSLKLQSVLNYKNWFLDFINRLRNSVIIQLSTMWTIYMNIMKLAKKNLILHAIILNANE